MWKVKWMQFPAHVYRSPSVQWTVCMKANVLIYKWVTLGKTWRCGALSFHYSSSQGSWLALSYTKACSVRKPPPRTTGRGQIPNDLAGLLRDIKSHPFRLWFIREVTEHLSRELDTAVGTQEPWTRRSWGPISQGSLHSLRKGGFFFRGRAFLQPCQGSTEFLSFDFNSWGYTPIQLPYQNPRLPVRTVRVRDRRPEAGGQHQLPRLTWLKLEA